MIRRLSVCLVLTILVAGFSMAQESTQPSAKERLKEAWSLKKTSFKQEADVKERILLQTVERYKAILDEFPEDKAACAEAGYRAAEILRTLKKPDEAKAEFQRVLTFDPSSEFAARALKEIGHIYRRNKEYDQAIAHYKRVIDECRDHLGCCADSMTWIGKVFLKQKKYKEARRIFTDFVKMFPDFPDDAIRNIDLAAGSWVDEGNFQEAESMLHLWRTHFESRLGQDDRWDKKVKKALEKMKTPERLKGGES